MSTTRSSTRRDEPGRRELVDHVGAAAAATGAPRAGPQRQRARLLGPGRGIEALGTRPRRDAPAVDRGDVALGRAHVPPAPAVGVAVRRAADAEVLALAPVEEVVAALLARAAPSSTPRTTRARPRRGASSASRYASAWRSSSGAARAGRDAQAERRRGLDGERVRARRARRRARSRRRASRASRRASRPAFRR